VEYKARLDRGRFTGTYRCEPIVPSVARRALGAWLRERTPAGENADDVTLVLSELVTNAVIHAKTDVRVIVTMGHTEIAVAVYDDSHTPPALLAPCKQRAGGYGLRVVEALSREWGWTTAGSGKQVWAVLDRH
jgi:anti-sigma regulatory factor (Ser/Thr protein kinase)